MTLFSPALSSISHNLSVPLLSYSSPSLLKHTHTHTHTHTHLYSKARDQGQLRWSRARSPHTSVMSDCLLVSPTSWDHITSNKLQACQIFSLSYFVFPLFVLQQQMCVSSGRRFLLFLLAFKWAFKSVTGLREKESLNEGLESPSAVRGKTTVMH